jgi:hypothetical protein
MENELTVVRDKYFLVIDNKGNRKLAAVNTRTMKMGKRELMVEFFEGKKLNTFWALDPVGEEDDTEGVFIHKTETRMDKYTEIKYNEFFGESLSKYNLMHFS